MPSFLVCFNCIEVGRARQVKPLTVAAVLMYMVLVDVWRQFVDLIVWVLVRVGRENWESSMRVLSHVESTARCGQTRQYCSSSVMCFVYIQGLSTRSLHLVFRGCCWLGCRAR